MVDFSPQLTGNTSMLICMVEFCEDILIVISTFEIIAIQYRYLFSPYNIIS